MMLVELFICWKQYVSLSMHIGVEWLIKTIQNPFKKGYVCSRFRSAVARSWYLIIL
ncbi:hypothetical protein Hanom_Chr12g01149021 [Helianthus anomalus]